MPSHWMSAKVERTPVHYILSVFYIDFTDSPGT